MDGTMDSGFASPEEAARGDIPAQFVTTLGTEVRGDSATVWLLTNDARYFEPITVFCELNHGRAVARRRRLGRLRHGDSTGDHGSCA
jgi:hypothetical protein